VTDRIMLDGIGTDAAAVTAAIRAGREFMGIRATMGAGYGDGSVSAWTSAEWVALTDVGQPVTVTVTGEADRNVADVENGDLTPVSGSHWAASEILAKRWPVLYVNRSNKAAVIAACKIQHNMMPGSYGLWVATLDGTFTDMDGTDLRAQPGVVAVQYLPAGVSLNGVNSKGEFDVSLVVDATWLPVKPPQPSLRALLGSALGKLGADLAAVNELAAKVPG
jgi:hypothetical protein